MIDGWEIKNIGSECELLNGYAFKSSDYVSSEGILNFRVTNINWDGTVNIKDDIEYLPKNFTQEFKKYLLEENDILFVMVGATRGKFTLIPKSVLPALMNQNMWRIIPKSKKLDRYFLYFYLRSKISKLFEQNEDQARGFFKKSDFSSLPLLLPPISEQHKIAYVLNTLQNGIEQQNKLFKTTTELKKALVQKLFTEGTKGEKQKQTEIGLVPESWEISSVEKEKTSMDYGTSVKCDYNVKGFPVVRIPNVISGKIDISDLKFGVPKSNEIEKLKLQKGDLIFVRTNGAKELTGRCAIFSDEISDCYFASYLIRVRLKKDIVPDFLNYYTQTEIGRSFLSGRSIRTADGKFNINTGILNNVQFPKPSPEEQKEIVSIIKLLESKADVLKKKKQTLTDLFKTLLHELMTGQRRVHEFEFETLIKEYTIEQEPLSLVAE